MNYDKTVIVRMTKKDHDKLKKRALKKGVSISEYVRRKLKSD